MRHRANHFASFRILLNLPAQASCTRMAASSAPLPFLPRPMAYSAERFAQASKLGQLLAQRSPDCAGDDALQFRHGARREFGGEPFCGCFGSLFRITNML